MNKLNICWNNVYENIWATYFEIYETYLVFLW